MIVCEMVTTFFQHHLQCMSESVPELHVFSCALNISIYHLFVNSMHFHLSH